MRDDVPQVDLKESFAGRGRLKRGSTSISITAFRLNRPVFAQGENWHFEATVYEGVPHREWDELLRAGSGEISFEGTLENGRAIRIPTIQFRQLKGNYHFLGAAWEVWLGEALVPSRPEYQYLTITLSTTPLALPEVDVMLYDTGEIKEDPNLSHKFVKPPQNVPFSIGVAGFALHYVYEDIEVGSLQSLARVPVPELYLEVPEASRTSDVDQLFATITSELQDFLRVLSFLSRTYVRWLRMRITTRWSSPPDTETNGNAIGAYGFDEAERLHAWAGARSNEVRSPLVNPYRLPQGALANLLSAYIKCEYKDAAEAAIIYLVSARNEAYVDTRLMTAFTALESLVNAIGKSRKTIAPLGASSYKALSKRLRETIRNFGTERALPEATIKSLMTKLSELARRPIVTRVAELLADDGISWTDLWNEEAKLADEIQRLYARRNNFVHGGHLESVSQASIDSSRVMILAERLLFHLLGGDTAWQDHSTFREAYYLAAEERFIQDAQRKGEEVDVAI